MVNGIFESWLGSFVFIPREKQVEVNEEQCFQIKCFEFSKKQEEAWIEEPQHTIVLEKRL